MLRQITGFVRFGGGWTLEHAAINGHPRLLLYLMGRQCPPLDPASAASTCNVCVEEAVKNDRHHVLLEFDRFFPTVLISTAVLLAAAGGRARALDWLRQCRGLVCWGTDAPLLAAMNGHLVVLCRLCSWLDVEPQVNMLYAAACRGHTAVAKWLSCRLRHADLDDLERVVSLAAVALAKWFVEHTQRPLVVSIDYAAGRGDLDFVLWATGRQHTATTRALDAVASGGFYHVVEHLHANRLEGCTTRALDHAIKNGHDDVVVFLIEKCSEGCSPDAFLYAAERGNKRVFLRLYENYGTLCPDTVFDHAARSGCLSLLRWLLAKNIGVPTHRAMDNAVTNGQLHIVRWLHDRGAGCTPAAMDGAACNGCLETVQWLHANRSEGCTTRAMENAIENEYMHVLTWLDVNRTEGFRAERALQGSVYSNSLEVVKWVHDKVGRGSSAAVDAAIEIWNTDVMNWIFGHCDEPCTPAALNDAARRGDTGLLGYISGRYGLPSSPWTFRHAVEENQLFAASRVVANARVDVSFEDHDVLFGRIG